MSFTTDSDQPALVGRTRERSILSDLLDGSGGLVLVSGEAGIGKTTLVNDLSRQAVASGAIALSGGCYDEAPNQAYAPWLDLVQMFQVTTDQPGIPDEVRVSDLFTGAKNQAALFENIRAFLSEFSNRSPVVLLIEDLQWADQASLDLLRFIARFSSSLRLLLMVTYRDEDLDRDQPLFTMIPLLIRETDATRINLRRWEEHMTRDLVASRYQLDPQDGRRLTAFLQAHADGNPFFTVELLRACEYERHLRQTSDGRWQLGDLKSFSMPVVIRQVLERRLSLLDNSQRELLQIAAVIGQQVPLDLWLGVSETQERKLDDAVQVAVEAALLRESADHTGFQFTHQLIQEALYLEVPLTKRRRLHQRTGEVLTRFRPELAGQIAHHFLTAEDARAYEWLLAAADQAELAWAWDTAAKRVEEALSLLSDDHAHRVDRGWLLFRLGSLHRWSRPSLSLDYLQQSAAEAPATGDADLKSLAAINAGVVRCLNGDYAQGILSLEQARAGRIAMESPPPEAAGPMTRKFGPAMLSGGADIVLMHWLANVGRLDDALDLRASLVDQMSTRKVDQRWQDGMSNGYGRILAGKGDPDRAADAFAAAFSGAADPLEQFSVLMTELLWLMLPYRTDRVERRRQLEQKRIALFQQSPIPYGVPESDLMMNSFCLLDGDWDVDRIRQSHYLRGESTSWIADFWRSTLAEMAFHQGDWDLTSEIALHFFPAGPGTKPGNAFILSAISMLNVMIEMSIAGGELDAAGDWLKTFQRWLDWSGLVIGCSDLERLRARFALADGDIIQAESHATQALSLAIEPRQPLALIASHRLLGELALVNGQQEVASDHLEQSLAIAEACQAPFECALTRTVQAELALVSEHFSSAMELIGDVRNACEPLQATMALDRIEQLERTLQSNHNQEQTQLTRREQEVLRYVARGMTNIEIGEKLYISPRTVAQHLSSVFSKTGVSNRAAAAIWAKERGLV